MNFRSYHLGGGVVFHTTWARFQAACAAVEADKAVGLISLKVDTEAMALEREASTFINDVEIAGRA